MERIKTTIKVNVSWVYVDGKDKIFDKRVRKPNLLVQIYKIFNLGEPKYDLH